MYIFQRLEEEGNVTDIVVAHKLGGDLFSDGNGEGYKSNAPDLDDYVKDVLDHLVREAVDEVGEEPFEDPHRLVNGQLLIEVVVELAVLAPKDVFENHLVDIRQWEAVLKEPQQQVPPVDGNVNEHPEGVELGVAYYKQVRDDKVYSLGVAHLRELVADSL